MSDPVELLAARGGFVAPSVQLYSFAEVPEAEDLISLPPLRVTRGGLRFHWNGRFHTPRWYARTRWGRRIKRALFGVEWADAPPSWPAITFVWPIAVTLRPFD